MPKMPELKDKDISEFTPFAVDIDTIPYADKTREKARQKRIKAEKLVGPKEIEKKGGAAKKMTAWSNAKAAREKKRERKEKKERKRAYLDRQKMEAFQQSIGMTVGTTADNNNSDDDDDDDWAELQREERQAKKMRRGKMSKSDFDREFGYNDEEMAL
jgi:ATP-dependent RNA helicase DDX55/SPB4